MNITTQNKNTNQYIASIIENPCDPGRVYDMGIIANKNKDNETASLFMKLYVKLNNSPFGVQSKIAKKIIASNEL
jgi:hypothetical protein